MAVRYDREHTGYSPLDMSRSMPANYPINRGELSSYPVAGSPAASEADKDWMGEEEEEWLLGDRGRAGEEDYGGIANNRINEAALARERLVRRKKRRRKAGRRLESTTVSSIASITRVCMHTHMVLACLSAIAWLVYLHTSCSCTVPW